MTHYTQTPVPTIYVAPDTSAADGVVRWAPAKSIWAFTMYGTAIIGGYFTASWEAFAVFLAASVVTLCLGHSLGMHRRLIHESYECPKWMEVLFVHLGTIVGLAGPVGMTRTHDTRDWAQRQADCHPYFGHRTHWLRDWWWQVHCDVQLKRPPQFRAHALLDSAVYRLMEKTWMAQQLPLALLLFALGGWAYVIWGVAMRVAVSITGHWLIGHFAHNHGQKTWHVNGASVQGYNIRFCGLITFGECWHNNHHAFPGSAKLGLRASEVDPGFWVLAALARVGLVWNIRLPDDLPVRHELEAVA